MLKNYFEGMDDTPPDLAWFERLWLGALALTAIITISMFDWSVNRVGPNIAVLLTMGRFGGTFLLMLFCSRRRSNVARLLVIPFDLSMLAYDVIRLPVILERGPVIAFIVLRLALMFTATYMLFTPRSRAWFAGKPPREEVLGWD